MTKKSSHLCFLFNCKIVDKAEMAMTTVIGVAHARNSRVLVPVLVNVASNSNHAKNNANDMHITAGLRIPVR